jgi:hypothetical protein
MKMKRKVLVMLAALAALLFFHRRVLLGSFQDSSNAKAAFDALNGKLQSIRRRLRRSSRCSTRGAAAVSDMTGLSAGVLRSPKTSRSPFTPQAARARCLGADAFNRLGLAESEHFGTDLGPTR